MAAPNVPARRSALTSSVAGIGLLGLIAVIASSSPLPWSITPRFDLFDGPRTGAPTLVPPPEPPTGPLSSDRLLPEWSAVVFWSLIGIALASVLWLLARRLWRRRPRREMHIDAAAVQLPSGSAAPDPDPEVLLRGAATALDYLAQIANPRDAVTRCWLALEQAAEASGAARRPADSPTEFTTTVLRATAADREAVQTLLRLYHRARFSDHPVGMEEVKAARVCVQSLCRSLSGYEQALRSSVSRETL
jgi:hypothetical protein